MCVHRYISASCTDLVFKERVLPEATLSSWIYTERKMVYIYTVEPV